jgi:adenosine deaminase
MTSPEAHWAMRKRLSQLPKIDLHRHLEGSLRLDSLLEVARQAGLDVPTNDVEALRPLVQFNPRDDATVRNFLSKFEVLRRFYQSPEIIQRLAYEAVADAAHDNVRYLELRFTPAALAKQRDYPLAEVTDWVLAAVDRARADHPSLEVKLIIGVNRHEPVDLAERVVQIAADRQARGIVGLDLAGDEVNFPAEPFRGVFRAAQEAGLGLVAHAGEWTGAATVRDAIEQLGVRRVGHGVRVVDDPAVAALARERGIVFEVCLTSNLQTGVTSRLAAHPLRQMLDWGLRCTLNTDDPGISAITLTDEYVTAVETLGQSPADIEQAILTAAAASLLPPADQAALVEQFRIALGSEVATYSPTPQSPRE